MAKLWRKHNMKTGTKLSALRRDENHYAELIKADPGEKYREDQYKGTIKKIKIVSNDRILRKERKTRFTPEVAFPSQLLVNLLRKAGFFPTYGG